jgi:outer membrane protein OmpA-like peptidoglycan-associated protein
MIAGAEVGINIRPDRAFADVEVGSEIAYRAGIQLPVISSLRLLAEIDGAKPFSGDANYAPLEGLFGARLGIGSLVAGAGVGVGFTDSAGTPTLRGLVNLGWRSKRPAEKLRREPDVIADEDRDGITDDEDLCPSQAEDIDGDRDADGCPDEDEVAADADRDGISDDQDGCKDQAVDVDGFDDEDGCPEDDVDGDGLDDQTDKCPREAEVVNGYLDEDGCPDEKRLTRDEADAKIPPPVLFELGSDALDPAATESITELADFLKATPEIQRVSIEGHASREGSTNDNQELSERRAKMVVETLVSQGVDRSRLESKGFGEKRMLDRHRGEEHQHVNRRVEVKILQFDPAAAPTP